MGRVNMVGRAGRAGNGYCIDYSNIYRVRVGFLIGYLTVY